MSIERWDSNIHGDLSEATLAQHLRSIGYAVCRYVYEPGTFFPDHVHDDDKIDAVLAGCFEITLEGTPYRLRAGQWIRVPRGAVHSARVVGDEPVVSLDAVRSAPDGRYRRNNSPHT